MNQSQDLKRGLAELLDRVRLMIFGAWLLIRYIDLTIESLGKTIKHIDNFLFFVFFLSWLIVSLLRPKDNSARVKEPSPRWIGSVVVLCTGFSGAYFVGMAAIENKGILVGAIALVTLAIAAATWSFATINATKIGEATSESRRSSSASEVG